MKRIIELRAGEGGRDAQLFVNDLEHAFIRLIDRMN